MKFKVTLYKQIHLQGHFTILKLQSVTQLNTVVKHMMTGTMTSSGRGRTAAVVVQNGLTAEEQ